MVAHWKKLLIGVALAMPVLLSIPDTAEARSRGFSRSRSSSWGRSSSRSRSSSWGRSKRGKAKKSQAKKKWGSSSASKPKKKFVTAPKNSKQYKKWSAADKKLASKAKSKGTSFKSRKQAVVDFKRKNSGKYKSTYAKKPDERPKHIPETYKDKSGNTYNVTYNQDRGGYGYMGPSGRWIMYDAMTDIAMMSLLMRQNDYYYPGIHPQPMVANPHYTSARDSASSAVVTILLILLIGLGVFVLICAIVANSS